MRGVEPRRPFGHYTLTLAGRSSGEIRRASGSSVVSVSRRSQGSSPLPRHPAPSHQLQGGHRRGPWKGAGAGFDPEEGGAVLEGGRGPGAAHAHATAPGGDGGRGWSGAEARDDDRGLLPALPGTIPEVLPRPVLTLRRADRARLSGGLRVGAGEDPGPVCREVGDRGLAPRCPRPSAQDPVEGSLGGARRECSCALRPLPRDRPGAPLRRRGRRLRGRRGEADPHAGPAGNVRRERSAHAIAGEARANGCSPLHCPSRSSPTSIGPGGTPSERLACEKGSNGRVTSAKVRSGP